MVSRRTFIGLAGSLAAERLLAKNTLTSVREEPLPFPDIWSFGQLLAFSAVDGRTDYEEGLVARSLEYPVGIEIMSPDRGLLIFGTNRIGQAQLSNDSFEIVTEKGKTIGVFVDTYHLLCDGPATISELPPGLSMLARDSLTLIAPKAHMNPEILQSGIRPFIEQRQLWLKQRKAPGGLAQDRRRTLSKALSVMKGQVCSAEGLLRHRWTTPDRWPHRDMWLWDSVFHAIGWRHVDLVLAREMIEAVFDAQQPDGRVPHQANPRWVSSITQPPVLALGCHLIAGSPPDLAWIDTLYPRLSRYIEWDMENRIAPGAGLAHWLLDPNPLSRCAESGMDNSPRFDSAAPLYAVDFNAYLSLECKLMAGFAQALGRPADSAKWLDRHLELNRLINERLWNEEAGFYFDEDVIEKRQTGVFAVSGFLPLLCGAATGLKVQRLAAHLSNPTTFATPVPLASAVLTPATSRPHDMWRGPMWMNTNWLVAIGFEWSGRKDVALKLRRRSLLEVEKRYLQRGSIFEFYDEFGILPPDCLPRKGPMEWGNASHQAVHDYGWTATLYADLAYTTPQ